MDQEFYKKVNANGLVCEVIFCTDDRTLDAYNHNMLCGSAKKPEEGANANDAGEDDLEDMDSPMPWPAITFENDVKRNNLKLRYCVKTMPNLVVVIWEHPLEEGKEGIRLIEHYGRLDIRNPEAALAKWRKEVVEPWEDDRDKFTKREAEDKLKAEQAAKDAEEAKGI